MKDGDWMVLFAENRDFLQIRFSGLSSYILFEKDDKYANWNTYYRKLDWYKQAYP